MNQNQVRIIAGKWRGRKIAFPNETILRPTPDRIKETLFNWLSRYIMDAHCLDVFAGSGALGFEALSRGAALTVSLEKNPILAKHLRTNVEIFKTDDMHIVEADAFHWLKENGTPFDIVFLDPPYQIQSLPLCCLLLEQYGWVRNGSLIYFESDLRVDLSALPNTWRISRQKKAGRIYYYLAQKT